MLMQLQQEPITLEAPPEVLMTTAEHVVQAAVEHFWQFRIQMNPRLILEGKWFPRTLARQLRRFIQRLPICKWTPIFPPSSSVK